MDKLLRTRFYIKKYFFTAHRVFIAVFYSIRTVFQSDSDLPVLRPYCGEAPWDKIWTRDGQSGGWDTDL